MFVESVHTKNKSDFIFLVPHSVAVPPFLHPSPREFHSLAPFPSTSHLPIYSAPNSISSSSSSVLLLLRRCFCSPRHSHHPPPPPPLSDPRSPSSSFSVFISILLPTPHQLPLSLFLHSNDNRSHFPLLHPLKPQPLIGEEQKEAVERPRGGGVAM